MLKSSSSMFSFVFNDVGKSNFKSILLLFVDDMLSSNIVAKLQQDPSGKNLTVMFTSRLATHAVAGNLI